MAGRCQTCNSVAKKIALLINGYGYRSQMETAMVPAPAKKAALRNKKYGMKIKSFLLITLSFYSSLVFSQSNKSQLLPEGAIQFTSGQMQWIDGPAALPKGTKMCLLYGDYKKNEPFAMRLKLPANQIVKLHIHTNDEVVTVLDGSVMIGFGKQIQNSEETNFTAGGFYVNPGKTEHFVIVGQDGVTIQINSIGPWTVEFK